MWAHCCLQQPTPASATQTLQTLWEDPQQWFPAAIEQPTTFLCCCCQAPLVKFCRCRYTRRLLAQHTRPCRDQCLSEQAALPSSCHPSRDCVSPSSHAGAQEGGWTQPTSAHRLHSSALPAPQGQPTSSGTAQSAHGPAQAPSPEAGWGTWCHQSAGAGSCSSCRVLEDPSAAAVVWRRSLRLLRASA